MWRLKKLIKKILVKFTKQSKYKDEKFLKEGNLIKIHSQFGYLNTWLKIEIRKKKDFKIVSFV